MANPDKPIRFFLKLLLIPLMVIAMPATAFELRPAFGEVTPEKIVEFFSKHGYINGLNGPDNWTCLLQVHEDSKTIACHYVNTKQPVSGLGKWRIENNTMVVNMKYKGYRGGSSTEKYHIKSLGEDTMRVRRDDKKETTLLVCDQTDRRECKIDDEPVMVLVKATNPDGRLKRALADVPCRWAVFFDGGKAAKARDKSEIYFNGKKTEGWARALATLFKDTTGPMVPKRWKWGGVYDVVMVLGDKRPGDLKVEIRDGHCGETAECLNAMIDPVKKSLDRNPYELSMGKSTKKPRTASEVWYKPGKRELAEKMVQQHLKDWVEPEALKEWTWKGDFDLLVIVGPPQPAP